jgi:DNA-binding YbaB/EbfC family protein
MNINPFDILKNAGKIQEKMGELQENLSKLRATGSSGGGMVEMVINGKMEVVSVKISAEAVEDRDIQMLEDLVMAAFTNGMEKIRKEVSHEMSTITGGLNIPGLQDFLGGLPRA